MQANFGRPVCWDGSYKREAYSPSTSSGKFAYPSVISNMIVVVNVPNCFTPLSLMVVDVQLIQSKDARRQKA